MDRKRINGLEDGSGDFVRHVSNHPAGLCVNK